MNRHNTIISKHLIYSNNYTILKYFLNNKLIFKFKSLKFSLGNGTLQLIYSKYNPIYQKMSV